MTRGSRTLSPKSNLDALRKEAKRWMKAIEASDVDAIARYAALADTPSETPKLREVQQALARDYGFSSWAALKQEIDDRARTHAERVSLFLEKSANRYSTDPGTQKWGGYERDDAYRGVVAARLLARHPEIARDSIHTAVVAGDVETVRGFLARDPKLVDDRSWLDRWTPLLRLGYARLPTDAARTNAIEIARLLLDAGADPNARWSDGENGFSVLTGVIGGGEGGQSPHPQAEAFARLLIERGADPLDGQALYNTSLGADDTFWLELMWSECEKRGQAERWSKPVHELGRPPLEYLIGNAVPRHPKRVAWLLAHGARADAVNAYSKQPVVEHAAMAGQQELVELLVQHGAQRPTLTDGQRFVAAAMQGDADAMRRLAAEHPELLRDPHAMFATLPEDRADVATLLLDLGMSPDIGDGMNFRALHFSTHWSGAIEVAKVLIAHGAEIDPIERRYNSTPLGHATFQRRPAMIALIAPLSRDVHSLCWSGSTARLRELLAAEPALANAPTRNGALPLFCLPDEDEPAMEVAELLLAHGADPSVKNAEGLTPAEVARKRGLEEAAELLGAAAKPG
jgi:ankyrin repeat protein